MALLTRICASHTQCNQIYVRDHWSYAFFCVLQSQLRTSLVGELKKSVHGKLTLEDLEVPESGSLVHRASNSLVAEHLRSCKYDYTYSVFLPECALDKAKVRVLTMWLFCVILLLFCKNCHLNLRKNSQFK